VLVLGKPPQPCLMLVGTARSLTLQCTACNVLPFLGSDLTSKHHSRLERLAVDKHSNVLQNFVNCVCKKFYNFDPRVQC